MSIHVYYQPIDIDLVQGVVFPYMRGSMELSTLLDRCETPTAAIAVLQPLRNAYAAHLAGFDYNDPEWGRCDATAFIEDRLVPAVLEFSRHIWPYWSANAFTSIELLPNGFPVVEHYQMPITLFQPFVGEFPNLASELATIANSERMGGVVRHDHVSVVLKAISDELDGLTRDSDDPYSYDAMKELIAALAFAAENGLSFTEAVE